MRPRRDGLAEFSKEQVHCGGIEPGHHQGDTGVACRADDADDPSGLVADIAQPARGMAALPPDIAGPPLLPDPRIVLAPDFKPLGLGVCLRDFGQARQSYCFRIQIGMAGRHNESESLFTSSGLTAIVRSCLVLTRQRGWFAS